MTFARRLEPSTAELGEAGERIAARFLVARGLRLLGRRVATRRGEVDLVLLDRARLVCVEVKTGRRAREGLWRPADSWRAPAFLRQRAAAHELCARGLGRGPARLDLVEVWIGPRGSRPEIVHHRDLKRPLP